MKTLIIIPLLLLALQLTYSQEAILEWAVRFSDGPQKNNYAECMAVDSMGNVFIAGRDSEIPRGFSVIKFSPSGQFLWRSRFSGGNNIGITPRDMTIDLQGNVYVGASDNRFVILKFSPSGVRQWVKIHDGGGATDIEGIYLADNNKLIVSGSTPLNTGGGGVRPGVRTMCLNTATGDSIWSRALVFHSPHFTFAEALDKTNITGDWYRSLFRAIITISYDINGNLKWWQTFPDSTAEHRNNYGQDITTDRNGNVYVAGQLVYSNEPYKAEVLKYDSLGNLKWQRIFNGKGYTFGYPIEIKTDPWGNVILCNLASSSTGDGDYIVQKYSPNGELLWWRAYNGPSNLADYPYGMSIDKQGSVYVTGTIKDQDYPPRQRIATVKYDKDGNLKWVKHYYPVFYPDSTGNPIPYAGVIVDQNLNVYVGGVIWRMHNGGGFPDALVLKYSQPIGIEPISTEIPGRFSLEQNYPNPFNPITKIKFSVPENAFIKLIIYDVIGK
ncbi:MAG: SBBP repeat-containing protein, partial [Ignavibacteria bacterium]|nr:SBBP repeat-containing protein [Ignavibacteria bacterium]